MNLLEAYRTLFSQWRVAFEIGSINRRQGTIPMSFRELLDLVYTRTSRTPTPIGVL